MIDFKTAKLQDGDFKRGDEYHELIDGSERLTFESWMTFDFEGTEDWITVEFTQEIEGYWTHCPGDYWTPPDSDFDLTDEEIQIVSVLINDVEIETIPELEDVLLKLVCTEIHRPAVRNTHARVNI